MISLKFRPSVAGSIVNALAALGVERVFGLPGVQNIEFFDALADAKFATYAPTNEASVMFMADACARLTGKIGVAVVTGGPGLTNAMTAIAEAKLDSSPVLIFTDGSSGTGNKSFRLHDIPQQSIASPLVKGYFKPRSPAEVADAVRDAAELALHGEPGPVIVEVPPLMLLESGDFVARRNPEPAELPGIEPRLDEAAERLRRGHSVGIYAGAGAIDAAEELRVLAELLQAPVSTTISGRGVIPEDHPLSVGFGFGRSGTAVACRVFRKIDTLLAVGCKYGETATGSYGVRPPPHHIHIDINPASLGKNFSTSISIVADAKTALAGLLSRLKNTPCLPNRELRELIQKHRLPGGSEQLNGARSPDKVRPAKFLRALRRRLDRDAILTTDSGMHQFWALNDFPVFAPRSFLAPADYQAMGFSIPAAIGAKLCFPHRQVVSLVGDGGFLMSGFECLNAVKWGAGISIVVFRDGAWGLIKEAQKRLHRRTPFTDLPDFDLEKFAGSFGMKFMRIADETNLEQELHAMLTKGSPCLVEVNVDYSLSPPYVKATGAQMFQNLPAGVKTKAGLRYFKRCVFPPRTEFS